MIQFEELRLDLLEYRDKLNDLSEALGLDAMRKEIASLEEQAAAADFWNDLANSQKVLQRTSQLKGKIEAYEKLKLSFEDALMMISFPTRGDLELLPECKKMRIQLKPK
jgi:peptide chain release factor 2